MSKRRIAIGIAFATTLATLPALHANATNVGTVSGVVSNAFSSSNVLRGICVRALIPATGSPAGNDVVTGPTGAFDIKLSPGTYSAQFFPCQTTLPYIPTYYGSTRTLATAKTFVVRSWHTTTVDQGMIGGGEISGRVATSAGIAIPGACVREYYTDPEIAVGPPVTTTKNGGYTLGGVPAGSVRVEFAAGCGAAGYVTQWWKKASDWSTATDLLSNGQAIVTGISAKLVKG